VTRPWAVAVGGDFFYPETTGPRPPLVDMLNSYLRRAIVAAQHDPVVARSVADVQNMLTPPPSVLRPSIMFRVCKGAGQPEPVAQLAGPVPG